MNERFYGPHARARTFTPAQFATSPPENYVDRRSDWFQRMSRSQQGKFYWYVNGRSNVLLSFKSILRLIPHDTCAGTLVIASSNDSGTTS